MSEITWNTLASLRPRALKIAKRLVGARDAEDVCSEALIAGYESREGFSGDNAAAWFDGVVTNVCNGFLRRKAGEPEFVELDEDRDVAEAPGPDLLAFAHEAAELSLEALPDDLRAVYLMREIEGYSHQEISFETGLPMRTVRSMLTRARKAMGVLAETM